MRLFRMYNQDKFNNDSTEELTWLFSVIDFKIAQGVDEEYANKMKMVAQSIMSKVYFDFGYKRLVENGGLKKMMEEEKGEKFGALCQY